MSEMSGNNNKGRHVSLEDIQRYQREGIFPDTVKTKGEKANFRGASKKFGIIDGVFMYHRGTSKRMVIADEKMQKDIIRDRHTSGIRRRRESACSIVSFWAECNL